MKVKPVAGSVVRDPVKGTLLPEDGAEVPLNTFWRRRLRDGDVVEVTATTSTTTASKATNTTSATVSASADSGPAATVSTVSTGAAS